MVNGAVFFDFDGTLVDEKVHIYAPTQKTVDAAAKLKENGYLIFLATGRARCYVPNVNIEFDGYVTSNGAYAEIDKKPVLNEKIDYAVLSELIEKMRELGIRYALENQDVCYTDGIYDEGFLRTLDTFNINRHVFMPVTPDTDIHCNKLIISFDREEQEEELKKCFSDRLIIGRHRSNLSSDVDAIGMTKAVGVEAVIKALKLSKDKTVAFGDGTNDYTMLSAVGHGIAMGDHAEILDGVCEFVTDSVRDEGIFNALKRLKMI